MRKQPLVSGEYYHIYNRGVDKRDIFSDRDDISRFIESIQEFNQQAGVGSIRDSRKTKKSQPESKALAGTGEEKKPLVAVVAYCLNPNHFHFLVKQLVDGGITRFMQKLQGGYTYYFNIRHLRTGSLFQGTFKSQHIGGENYFNKILGYVNKNYEIHSIPRDKVHLTLASDSEYEQENFQIISKEEGERMLEVFNGSKNLKKHSCEIVNIIRQERGKLSLLEEDVVPARV